MARRPRAGEMGVGTVYSWGERARRLGSDEIWNLGVVDQTVAQIARHGITSPPRWLPPQPPGVLLADPGCLVRPDGSRVLYAERLEGRGRRVGEIWRAELAPGEDPVAARFTPMLVRAHHLSYPAAVLGDDGAPVLTMESWQANQVSVVGEAGQDMPGLLPGQAVVDPTLWRARDRWWLFCTLRSVDPDGALFLYHAPSLAGPWTPHASNPVKLGRDGVRPAGKLFMMDDVLVRPGQDCRHTYGGAVVLFAVTRLDEGGYAETLLRRLPPPPGPYASGMHTLCEAGPVTLIDGKRWQVSAGALQAKLRRKLRRLRRSAAAMAATAQARAGDEG